MPGNLGKHKHSQVVGEGPVNEKKKKKRKDDLIYSIYVVIFLLKILGKAIYQVPKQTKFMLY